MITVNNKEKIEWSEDITVQDILDQMGYTYSLITVRINDEHIPSEEYSSKKVPDNSDVTVFHLAHGG